MKGSHPRPADRCPFVLGHSISQITSFMQLGRLWCAQSRKAGKADHKAAYIRARKSVQSALKQARWGYINGILQAGLDEGTSKPFSGYIRQQRQDNVGVSPLKKDGKIHADSLSRCEILASQFKSVFTKASDDPLRDTALFGPSYSPIDPLIIREEGIRKLLSSINPSKAAGPDQVPCRLLKELSNELAPIFTYLFKQSLATGKLPSVWHIWVTPVLKKGPRNLLRIIDQFHWLVLFAN